MQDVLGAGQNEHCKRICSLLPNDKILEWSKLKAFADGKINVAQKLKLAAGRVENIVGKGENAGDQHFCPFPSMFSKGYFLRVSQSRDCVVKGLLHKSSTRKKLTKQKTYFSFL